MSKLQAMINVVTMIICSCTIWYLYHKFFHVYYFNLTRGCLMEVMACLFGGVLLAGVVLKFWYIAIIIIGILVFSLLKKSKR